MRRTSMCLAAVVGLMIFTPAAALAEEMNLNSYSQLTSLLEEQERRISELEAALSGPAGAVTSTDACCGECCDACCCDPCCRSRGVIGGAEITFLKPHHSRGINGPIAPVDFDFDYEAAPRFWAGWQGSDGLGVRVRYWQFDHAQSFLDASVTPPDTHVAAYDVYVLDAEVFDSMSLGCYWDASVFAGFRYVDFSEERYTLDENGVLDVGTAFGNSSIGLTLGGELRRCIGNDLAGFINTRTSVLMGDEKEFGGLAGTWFLLDEELDNIYYIWEAQAGVQWTRQLQDSGYLFARAAVEVQVWDNVSGEPFFDGGEAWGLGGFTFSAGVIR